MTHSGSCTDLVCVIARDGHCPTTVRAFHCLSRWDYQSRFEGATFSTAVNRLGTDSQLPIAGWIGMDHVCDDKGMTAGVGEQCGPTVADSIGTVNRIAAHTDVGTLRIGIGISQ